MAVKTSSIEKPRKWYNSYTFPLIPVIGIREKNYYNTKAISFHWLFIKMWTLDHIDFECAIVFSDHWGVGVTAILPYLRIAICIPIPEGFFSKLRRKSESEMKFEKELRI